MLVITIIVIIILAVAVILTLSNNNPIENARRAVDANDEATMKEAATLAYADWYMEENMGEGTGKDADTYVKDQLKDQGFSQELINRLTVTNEGKITIENTTDEVTVVEGVTIPKGFKHVSGTTVATGLVIKNKTDGNEFVWVPVETGTFVREAGYYEGELETIWNTTDYIEPYETDEYTTEGEEYDAMVASVSKYGGFYIARYEASETSPGSGIAQSISNKTPWGTISWGASMTDATGGAVEAARAVYPDSNTKTIGDVVSTLPYGVQWDATVRFLEKSYDGIAQDSTEKGNYTILDEEGDLDIIPTGSNSDYALNNIYDMAGNVQEWTMEAFYSDLDGELRVYRGGSLYHTGIESPISNRELNTFEAEDSFIGFRLALYIK